MSSSRCLPDKEAGKLSKIVYISQGRGCLSEIGISSGIPMNHHSTKVEQNASALLLRKLLVRGNEVHVLLLCKHISICCIHICIYIQVHVYYQELGRYFGGRFLD